MATIFAQVGAGASTTSQTTHAMNSQSVSSLTNGVGFVYFLRNDGANSNDVVTDVTWGGVSMTRVATITNSQPFALRLYLYALAGPSTGTVNIVTTSSSAINGRMNWFTVSDANQAQPEASNTLAATNSTTITPSVTTLTNDALVVGIGAVYAGPGSDYSGTISRDNDFDVYYIWTSAQATAGSNTSGLTGLGAGTDSVAIVASVPPVGGSSASASTLMMTGVGT